MQQSDVFYHTIKTCNQTEQSKVKLFVVLWKHVMEIENETPILSCILWKIFKTLYSTQLFEIWTLSYCDNVTGHTLVVQYYTTIMPIILLIPGNVAET